ncbi:regucalcin like protein [Choiromyces venosus 120613-1]|uniref:Regucalcin like protein n=1 Tax=Choiromyces venosus 120613-1 TaxID=1336337 RepID=A0A3N4JGP4_9PEZI|nr:regucalcin like protein [Choiromyces venosus 120613-1]
MLAIKRDIIDKASEWIYTSGPYLPLKCQLGEGPFYEEGTGELRFVDIIKKEIHSVNLKEGPSSHKVTKLEHSVGENISLLRKLGFAIFNKATGELKYIKKVYDNAEKAERFNNAAVDTKGRFWTGAMNDPHVGEPQQEGCVFRLDPDLTHHRMIENVSIPNGMGWSPDDKTMYFTDSPTRNIVAYDYDSETGSVSNKRTLFTVEEEGVVPDGCTIDTEGFLWIALHEGSRVIRIPPEGKILGKITCPIFGGLDLNELFTTAGVGEEEPKPEGSVDNGAVFRIRTSSKGLPANKFILSAKP